MSADDAPAPTRTAPIALWRVAQSFLHTLHALFGAPEDVAAEHTLVAHAHKLMASWLRCAEAMLRRLLLIEASAYPKPNTRPLLHETRQRERKAIGFSADAPEQWRVSFRMFVGVPRLSSPARGGGGRAAIGGGANAQTLDANSSLRPLSHASRDSSPASGGAKLDRRDRWHQERWPRPSFRSAWPLAERYEALIRVYNNPAPYAQRLARRLHAAPHRIGETLRFPPEAEHRIEDFLGLSEHAEKSWRPFFSSA